MNKKGLVDAIVSKAGTDAETADDAITAIRQMLIEQLPVNEKIKIVNFGTFTFRTRVMAHPSINQADVTAMEIIVGLKPSKGLVRVHDS